MTALVFLAGLLLGVVIGFRRGREYSFDINRGRRVARIWRVLG